MRFFRASASSVPTFEVKIRMAFPNDSRAPLLSVTKPSSITCSRRLWTLGSDFSISSKSTVMGPSMRAASDSTPRWSWPM
jgi:hypothetical protein